MPWGNWGRAPRAVFCCSVRKFEQVTSVMKTQRRSEISTPQMGDNMPSARALAKSLLSAAFAAEGGPPSQLSEEDFLAAEASVIECPPSPLECCLRVHRRCVFDAVNEALDELSQPPPTPRGLSLATRSANGAKPASRSGSIASLLAAAHEQRISTLDCDGWTQRVLALMPEPSAPPVGLAVVPDDIGATTRRVWKQLLPEWSDFGEDEMALARSEVRSAESA